MKRKTMRVGSILSHPKREGAPFRSSETSGRAAPGVPRTRWNATIYNFYLFGKVYRTRARTIADVTFASAI